MFLITAVYFFFFFLRTYVLPNEFIWYITYYVGSSASGLALLYSEIGWSILNCQEGGFSGWQGQSYYQMQMGFYFASIGFLLTVDKENKDNGLDMLLHHIITIGIITLAYLFPFQRAGFAVLLLHDISDVFLYWARYLKSTRGKEDKMTQIVFGFFVVSFVVLRLICFPLFIAFQCVPNAHQLQHFCAVGALILLYLLHCYWFTRIWKIITSLWRGKDNK